jgi:hypothetical protein
MPDRYHTSYLRQADQVIHNMIIYEHSSLFADGELIVTGNNESLIHNMHFEIYGAGHFQDSPKRAFSWEQKQLRNRQSFLGVESRYGLIPAVLHQFDRDVNLELLVDQKYNVSGPITFS